MNKKELNIEVSLLGAPKLVGIGNAFSYLSINKLNHFWKDKSKFFSYRKTLLYSLLSTLPITMVVGRL